MPTSPYRQPRSTRISTSTLVDAIGQWSVGPGRLYRQLANAVAAAVDRSDIPAGATLPPERAIARDLAIARGTVVRALEDLQEAGYIQRRQGSGTYIRHDVNDAGVVHEYAAGLRARRLTGRLVRADDAAIDLAVSVLPSTSGLPVDSFNLDPERIETLADGHGYHPLGLPALRKRLAELHTRHGIPTAPGQIAVTLGAQQAIALSARLVVKPGDVVAVESPTYPGAIDAYSRAGAHFVTCEVDAGGARTDSLRRVLDDHSPGLVYLVPTGHNPTGTVMPDHRRREIAELTADRDLWVVEDECLAWSVFDRDAPPLPVAAHTSVARTLTIGSLSKLFWGGLRVGWIRAPEPVIGRIGRLKAAQDLGNCAVSQTIALRLLDDVDEIATERRKAFAARADVLCTELTRHLPDWTFRRPDAGLSIWVKLPTATSEAFVPAALNHGVVVLPGSAASADDTHRDCLRLSFALPEDQLREAVKRLASAWNEYKSQHSATQREATAS